MSRAPVAGPRRWLPRRDPKVGEPGRESTQAVLPSSACFAPATQLYLAPGGEVRVCCRNFVALGNVVERSLLDIWQDHSRTAMVDELAAGRYPRGCEPCGVEAEVEGRDLTYPARYDRFAPALVPVAPSAVSAGGRHTDDEPGRWPQRIEFNLSNVCNLMCIQCDGRLSSMIRAHREHLPPLPRIYGDEFFDDLARFIPHLAEAQFAGGEPFLARENFRVWDLIAELNPDLRCTVVTNATQWNDRIEQVGRTLRMGYTFSIDGITRETYEQVRERSDFDRVMENIPRYMAMAEEKEARVEVNFCLMRQNHHEFADLLLWADSLGVEVNVCVVRSPEHCSIAAMPPDELEEVADGLRRADESVRDRLEINRAAWIVEFERIQSWAAVGEETKERLWWSPAWEVPTVNVSIGDRASSLGLLLLGGASPDLDREREQLARWGADGEVLEVFTDFVSRRDDDHVITSVSDSVTSQLGCGADALVGQPLTAMGPLAVDRYGPVIENRIVEETGTRTESVLILEGAEVRSVALPTYTAGGLLESAVVLSALRPRPSPTLDGSGTEPHVEVGG